MNWVSDMTPGPAANNNFHNMFIILVCIDFFYKI